MKRICDVDIKKITVKYYFKSLFFTFAIMFITTAMLLNYVANSFGGNINWLIMPSSFFGVPDELTDQISTLYEEPRVGWDGQFYYYISNDLLGDKDTASHIDSPSYRYQRIGLPLIARCVGWLFGQKYVSVSLFTFVNLAILTVAVLIYAIFLEKRGKCLLWILPWIFSVGVQITARHALPDGAADAFMIIALILLLNKKYVGYSISITFASLCREANISIAAVIFLMGFFGLLEKDKKFNIKFAAILAFPGIIFVAWYLYVTVHFGAFPFKQAHGITAFFGTGFVKYLDAAMKKQSYYEIIGCLIYALTIISALLLEISRGFKNHVYWALIPFTILSGSFGPTVMAHYSGYLKGISSLFFYIPLMLLENESLCKVESKKVYTAEKTFAAVFLGFVFVSGLWTIPNHAANQIVALYDELDRNETAQALTNFNSSIYLNKNWGAKWVDMPYSDAFNAEGKYTVLNVHIQNDSNQVWSHAPNSKNANAVYASYHWFKANNLNDVYLDGFRNSIKNDLEPGESTDIDILVRLPQEPGQYVLRVTLLQEGVSWFYNAGGAYIDIDYVIK